MTKEQNDQNPIDLAEVRSAYRTVHQYQARLYDIIGHIPESMGLEYFSRDAGGYHLAPSTHDITKKDVWDGIPLYNLSVLLLPKDQDMDNLSEGRWMLVLDFLADRDVCDKYAYDEAYGELEKFPPVGGSESVLRIYLHQVKSEPDLERSDKKSKWYKVFNCDYFPELEQKIEYEDDYKGIVAYGKEFNLTKLQNEAEWENCLIEFKKAASEKLGLSENFFVLGK